MLIFNLPSALAILVQRLISTSSGGYSTKSSSNRFCSSYVHNWLKVSGLLSSKARPRTRICKRIFFVRIISRYYFPFNFYIYNDIPSHLLLHFLFEPEAAHFHVVFVASFGVYLVLQCYILTNQYKGSL